MKKLALILVVIGLSLAGTDAFALAGIDAYTVLMLHFNGEDSSTNFIDSSFSNHTVTANGNAQIDTAQKQFGSASGLFDGSGDYLSLADSDDWFFSSEDFSIDFWIRFNDILSDNICGQWVADGDQSYFQLDPAYMAFYDAQGGDNIGFAGTWAAVDASIWHHIALVRDDNNWYFFVDGSRKNLILTGIGWSATLANHNAVFSIGADKVSGIPRGFLNGWLDEFRVSNGIARWTSNFSLPTSEHEIALTPIPEPASMLLLGIGGLLAVVFGRKRRY